MFDTTNTMTDKKSELSSRVEDLRKAIAAEQADPLPCSGGQACARRMRVLLETTAVLQLMQRCRSTA